MQVGMPVEELPGGLDGDDGGGKSVPSVLSRMNTERASQAHRASLGRSRRRAGLITQSGKIYRKSRRCALRGLLRFQIAKVQKRQEGFLPPASCGLREVDYGRVNGTVVSAGPTVTAYGFWFPGATGSPSKA